MTVFFTGCYRLPGHFPVCVSAFPWRKMRPTVKKNPIFPSSVLLWIPLPSFFLPLVKVFPTQNTILYFENAGTFWVRVCNYEQSLSTRSLINFKDSYGVFLNFPFTGVYTRPQCRSGPPGYPAIAGGFRLFLYVEGPYGQMRKWKYFYTF